MNPAHAHLLLNHLPIVGTFIALPLLVLAFARPSERSSLYAVVQVLVLAAGGAVAANRTGEAAEEQVKNLPGVAEQWIHVHSQRADVATVLAVIAGAAALGLLGWTMRGARRADPALPVPVGTPAAGLAVLTLLTALSGAAMVYTGLAGGQIHHPELRAEADSEGKSPDRAGSETKGRGNGRGKRARGAGGERAGGERAGGEKATKPDRQRREAPDR